MLKEYKEQAKERKVLGIPPLPLTADDVTEIVGALQQKKGIDCLLYTSPSPRD